MLLSILFYIINPAFLSALNISNFFAYFPELGIMALCMTYLLIAGEFDLSIGAIFAFAPVIMFALRNNAGIPIEWAWLISIILSAFLGFVNGILVTKVRISSFLATLGMMLIVRGIALFVANAFPQSQWSTDSPLKDVLAGSSAGPGTSASTLVHLVPADLLRHAVRAEDDAVRQLDVRHRRQHQVRA